MQIFKRKPKVTFWSNTKGFKDIIKPEKANQYIPKWFKYASQSEVPNNSNVKNCIGFTDYFKMGYVIPLWCDLNITINELGNIGWQSPHSYYQFDFHHPFQLQNLVPEHEKDKMAVVIKTHCPYHARVTKGYSLLQLPMTYWYEKDWTMASGIFPTSIYPELNQQIIIYKSFFDNLKPYNGIRSRVIPKGTPLAQYMIIPNEYDGEVVEETKELAEYRYKTNLNVNTTFQKKFPDMLKCPYVKR